MFKILKINQNSLKKIKVNMKHLYKKGIKLKYFQNFQMKYLFYNINELFIYISRK